MRDLIDDVFVAAFDNRMLSTLERSGAIADPRALAAPAAGWHSPPTRTSSIRCSSPAATSVCSAVNGTVNDLAVGGARPALSLLREILEEGLDVAVLRRVVRSMADAAERAGVCDRDGRHQGRPARCR
jgi:hydrogenase expression/formation protein HypE